MDYEGHLRLTQTERFQRLKRHLEESGDEDKLRLLDRLNDCQAKWHGSYECLSPACPDCRRRNEARQQRTTVERFTGVSNSEAAFITILLPGTRETTAVGWIMRKAYDVLRKRIAAARAKDPRWNYVCVSGWTEIDAVAPEHLPLLFSDRATIIPKIAPVSVDQSSCTWLPTIHAIGYLGSIERAEVRHELARSWDLPGQVDVSAFDTTKSAKENLEHLAGYANKFACRMNLKAKDVVGGKVIEPWPSAWEGSLFSYLNGLQRNAFECLRVSVRQSRSVVPVSDDVTVSASIDPMPFTCTFSGDHTRNILGGEHAWR